MHQRHRDEFAAFARASTPSLHRLAMLLTAGNRTAAEDLLQATYERLLRRWHKIEGVTALAYARTVLANLAADERRRLWRGEMLLGETPDTAGAGHEEAAVLRGSVLDILRSLPSRQRAVLVLRFYEDMSEEDIAATMNVTRGTVKSQCFKALERIRNDDTAMRAIQGVAMGVER